MKDTERDQLHLRLIGEAIDDVPRRIGAIDMQNFLMERSALHRKLEAMVDAEIIGPRE